MLQFAVVCHVLLLSMLLSNLGWSFFLIVCYSTLFYVTFYYFYVVGYTLLVMLFYSLSQCVVLRYVVLCYVIVYILLSILFNSLCYSTLFYVMFYYCLRCCLFFAGHTFNQAFSLLYSVFADDKLIYLDPHCCQDFVDVTQQHFPLHVSLSKFIVQEITI